MMVLLHIAPVYNHTTITVPVAEPLVDLIKGADGVDVLRIKPVGSKIHLKSWRGCGVRLNVGIVGCKVYSLGVWV